MLRVRVDEFRRPKCKAWVLSTHLSSRHEDPAIRRPGHRECLSADIETAYTSLRSHIPKPDGTIRRATRQLRVFNWVE